MADPNIPHLGDLTDLNDLAPRHPMLNGVDGFQNAHIIATNLWNRALGKLMGTIDPDGRLSPDMASNVRHAPETKPGGMALGTWVHNGQQQKAFDALAYDEGPDRLTSNQYLNKLERNSDESLRQLRGNLAHLSKKFKFAAEAVANAVMSRHNH